MTVFGQECLHRDAVEYYYGFVDQHMADVPEHIVRHVRQCRLCKSQIRRLQEVAGRALDECDGPRDEMNRDIIDILNTHFQCVGESVTCSRAKPLLPSLLFSAPGIRIPTPITVHVDHCPQCAEALRLLGGLELEDGQWERLSRLYRENSESDPALCHQARLKIPAFAAGSIEGLDSGLVRHLCVCPECRAQVYQYRAKLLESMVPDNAEAGTAGGRHISASEAFDYVVACDPTSPGTDQAKTRAPTAGAHVRQCRRCMEKVQAVHHAVYAVAERMDSGVATVYTTLEQATEGARPEGRYRDYPINVAVSYQPAAVAAQASRPMTAAGKVSYTAFHSRLKPWLTAAVVAAALTPLALLFVHTSTAEGITLAQVVEALAKAPHVYFSVFREPSGQLIEEAWVSRRADLCLVSQGRGRVLYDLGAKKKYRSLDAANAEVADVGEDECVKVRRMVDGALGFDSSSTPAGATWTRIPEASSEGDELYELTCMGQDLFGRPFFRKWVVTVDPVTRLPKQVEAFVRQSPEHEWDCRGRREYRYLTDAEMATVMGQ